MKPLRVSLVLTALFFLSAAPLSAQKGQVTCKDGTKSAGGRGACSSHGGIGPAAAKAAPKAATKSEAKAAKVEKKVAAAPKLSADEQNPVGATAECKDHTYSHAKSHRGACSRHGGVAKFLDGKK